MKRMSRMSMDENPKSSTISGSRGDGQEKGNGTAFFRFFQGPFYAMFYMTNVFVPTTPGDQGSWNHHRPLPLRPDAFLRRRCVTGRNLSPFASPEPWP